MNDKVCLVTGATLGIGRETALALARQGATLVIVGRDAQRTGATVEQLREASGNPRIEAIVADLSSQADVRRVAADLKQKHARLDVLVNNAGGMFATRKTTVDGFEHTWALNHLAYFTLTLELLELLQASDAGRIVNVSSAIHYRGRIDFDDTQGEKSYGAMERYAQSKLANVLFTYALARRLNGTKVTANCLHPGVVATGFGHNNKGLWKVLMTLGRPFMTSASDGSATSVYLATSSEVQGVTGKYFDKCRPKASAKASHDEASQERLWALSLEQTGRAA